MAMAMPALNETFIAQIKADVDENVNYGISMHFSQAGMNALQWTALSICTIFLAARLYIRLAKQGRTLMDDYFIIAAWVFLLVNVILQTIQNPDIYMIVKYGKVARYIGEKYRVNLDMVYGPELAAEFVERGTRFLKFEFTIIGLFWTIIWLVKGSFLAFFYTLFEGLPNYRRAWWFVVVFAFFAYAGAWITSALNCHPVSNYFVWGACGKPADEEMTIISIAYSTTVDVLIDVMIMAMPLSLLWKVQISTKQKLALAGVFSLGIVITIFAIIRAIEVTTRAREDTILLAFWSCLESAVSVVVGCLPPFKSLFANRHKGHSGGYNYYGETGGLGSGLRHASMPLQSHATIRGGRDGKFREFKSESRESIIDEEDGFGGIDQRIVVKKDVVSLS
jgi:hypothetical protein